MFILLPTTFTTSRSQIGNEIAPNVPPTIFGDALRIRQILLNLTGNALKFTHYGEVLISVRAWEISPRQIEIEIAVSDTGIGIPLEKQSRLFKPFSQADSSTTRKYGGTGLGLTISLRLAEKMGGGLEVESVENQGSTFRFRFLTEFAQTDVEPAIISGLSGMRILVVDDNALSCKVLERFLESSGMVVNSACSGKQALDLINQSQRFDGVILDGEMPEMSGLELAVALQNRPGTASLPLILLSSTIRQNPRNESNQTWFAAIIAKPVKMSSLLQAIVRLRPHLPEQTIETSLIPQPEPSPIEVLPFRILLAEDNLVNQKVTRLMLARLGYQVDVATNGFEALERVSQQHYELILMGMQMPGMDGIEATQRIRADRSNNHRPYIVGLTANVFLEDRKRFFEAGVDDFITKPVRLEKLRQVFATMKTDKLAG